MGEERRESTMDLLLDELEAETKDGAPEGVPARSVPPPLPSRGNVSLPPPLPRATPAARTHPDTEVEPAPEADLEDAIDALLTGAEDEAASDDGPPAPAKTLASPEAAEAAPPPLPLAAEAAPPPLPPAAGAPGLSLPPPLPPERVAATLPTEIAEAMVASCDRALAREPEPRRAARLHLERGRLLESPIGDLRRALSAYEKALTLTPNAVPALRGARRILLARRSFAKALALFDEELRVTAEPAGKSALLLEKGQVLADALRKPDEARRAFENAFELERGNAAALRALATLHAEAGDERALERVQERAANAASSDPRHRAALVARRARLVESQGQHEKAAELYETALRLDERAPGALTALERLHHASGRWRDLIRVLELRATQAARPRDLSAALHRAARVHAEHLGNRQEAVAALERAREATPEEPLVLEELSRHYELAGRWEDLASALEALVQTVRAPRERLALLRRIGELHAQRTDRPERAIHWYEAALGVDPADAPALQALTPLYEATESWEELARMLLQAATRTGDPATRAAAHARIAELKETRLGDKDAAIEHHTKALSALPGHAASFKALTRLFGEAGRHRELLELYERAADEADEATVAVSHLFKVGALYEDALGEPAQATHAYRRILDLDRGNLSAIHALQRAAERAGRHPELVEAIELEVARVEETPRVVALLHRAGEILEMRLRDKEGALQRYRRALERDASYRPALESLGRLYHATGRWEDLLETCGRELALDPGRERTLTLLHTMGQLCADRLGREEEGLAYFWRALELDAEDGPALQALTRRLAEGDDAEALTRALEAELAARDDPRARGRAALRLGEVRESRSGDLEAAEQAYAEARAEAPELVPARTSLRRVRAARGSWEAVALDLAEEALEATEAGDEARAAALRLEEGVVLADRLRQPARAIAAFEAARDLDATSLAPLLSLEELYRATRAWSDLAATHARVAELAEEPGQRIAALRAQLRVVEAHELADSPRSARALEEAIVVLDPSDRGALVSLEARALAELATADAGTEGPILRRLLDVERRLGRLGGPADLRAHHVTRAAEAAEALDERDTALALFRDALTLDGGSFAATRGLSRVAEAEDDPVLLAEAARREAEIAADAAAAARLLLRSAMVRTERLGDRSGAEADLERALELDAGSETASQMLIELLEARGAYERLGDVLTRAAGASEGDRSAALWAEVARLQAGPLGNLAAAIASLQRVLRDAPNHVPTLRALADLYTRDEQPAEASRLLGRIVKLAPPRRVLKDAHLGLAELWLGPLGDAQRALVSLQAVLAIDPADARALEQLAELHEHAGRLGDAREAAERLLASSEGAARAAALLRLGRLRDAEGDDAAALEAYAEGVALEGPGSESALELKALAMGPAAFESYVAALRRYLMRDDAREHVGALLEIARVLGDSLARPRAAIEVLEEGVASHPKELRLRRELGLRLRDAGDAEHAASAFEDLASADPTRPEGWRELSRTHLAMERRVEARIAAEPLAVLGVPDEGLKRLLREAPPRPGGVSPDSFGPALLDRLAAEPPETQAVTGLLRVLEPALAKLYPADLASYGLSVRDRVGTRSGHPLRAVVDGLAAALGTPAFEVYVHGHPHATPRVELGATALLLVPEDVLQLSRSALVFLLTKALVQVARRVPALAKLTPREIEVVLAAAARHVKPEFGRGLTGEDVLADQSRRLFKALPRRQRKAFEEAARAYVEAGRVDFPAFHRRADRLAARVAALVADDLAASVRMLVRGQRDLQGREGKELLDEGSAARELVTFWASGAALQLRQHAGLITS